MKYNPLKCAWMVQKGNGLSRTLDDTRWNQTTEEKDQCSAKDGSTPRKDHSSVLTHCTAVNYYYKDFWPRQKRRTHVLAPLTAMTGSQRNSLTWDSNKQAAFEETKARLVVAADAKKYQQRNVTPRTGPVQAENR